MASVGGADKEGRREETALTRLKHKKEKRHRKADGSARRCAAPRPGLRALKSGRSRPPWLGRRPAPAPPR